VIRAVRLSISLAAILPFFLWPACVSRSLPEARFADSRTLQLQNAGSLPQVADPDVFSFSAVGDLHIKGSPAAWLSRMLAASSADGDAFSILLGDLADTGEAAEVDAYLQAVNGSPLAGKVFYVLGNHDIFSGGWENFKKNHGPSHYSFTVGNSKFIALDTADASLGEKQTQWLTEELGNSTETHRFMLSHYPPIVPGIRSYLRFADTEEAQHLMRTATNSRVSAWLAGHYHSYILDTIDGVQYLVAGGGGGRRMHPVWENFYVKVSVNHDKVSFDLKKLE